MFVFWVQFAEHVRGTGLESGMRSILWNVCGSERHLGGRMRIASNPAAMESSPNELSVLRSRDGDHIVVRAESARLPAKSEAKLRGHPGFTAFVDPVFSQLLQRFNWPPSVVICRFPHALKSTSIYSPFSLVCIFLVSLLLTPRRLTSNP